MTALVLALLCAAPPPVLVVRRETAGVPEAAVAAVVRRVVDGLTAEGLAPGEVKLACAGDAACLATAARDAHAAGAIGVTVLKSRKGLSVDLEAIAPDARSVAVETFPVPSSGEPFPIEGADFLKKAGRALAPPSEDDAPRATSLAPAPKEEVGVALEPRGNAALRVAATSAVVTGVLGLGFGVAGGVYGSALTAKFQPGRRVPQTRDSAVAEAGLANGLMTASLIASLVAVAAGTTAVVLWATGD